MKPVQSLLILGIVVFFAVSGRGQKAGSSDNAADTVEVKLLRKSIEAQGGAHMDGVERLMAAGSIVYFGGGGSSISGTASLAWSRGGQFRFDTQLGERLQKVVVSRRAGQLLDHRQRPVTMSPRNALLLRSMMFPGLEMAERIKDRSAVVSVGGLATVNGKDAVQILITVRPEELGGRAELTIQYYLDVSSYLPLRRVDMLEGEAGHGSQYERQIDYADYRECEDIMLPFQIRESIGSQKTYVISINHAQVNGPMSGMDFSF
jgi:hypothetical protein